MTHSPEVNLIDESVTPTAETDADRQDFKKKVDDRPSVINNLEGLHGKEGNMLNLINLQHVCFGSIL